MRERILGRQGLTSSAIGYGSMGVSVAYGPADEQGGIEAIRRAYDLGVTHFDTAEMYGWGDNERIVGRAVKGFRDDVILATKFGFTAPTSASTAAPRISARCSTTACAISASTASTSSTSTAWTQTFRSKMSQQSSRRP